MTVRIREETSNDRDAIRALNDLAFGGEEEGRLVDRLREEGLVISSLVAVENDEVVGHILFGELPIETDGKAVRGASLAPMAVRPDRQRRGIGSALIRKGLEACRERGVDVVIVVGHPAYYPRFGFSAEKAKGLRAPFRGEAFMALELTPDVLAGVRAKVRYPAAFGLGDDEPAA